MKIIVVGAKPRSLLNFRGELLTKLVKCGHEVIAMASGATDLEVRKVEELGVRYLDYRVERNGLNPLSDYKAYLELKSIFRKESPEIILAYTIKPIIWGGLASQSLKNVMFYALVTGLGFAFQGGGWKKNILRSVVIAMYRTALKRAQSVIFQNLDNLKTFGSNKIIPSSKGFVVGGSGVNLDYFKSSELPLGEVSFITIARLLGDKGLREYVMAARIVKHVYSNVSFKMLGAEDSSPNGIPSSELSEWINEGVVEYLGSTDDVRPYIRDCHVYVLASYHEGLPRTVLEAMAVGRPILTTNVPGCRETVVDGVNGFLVEKENVEELANKMFWFIDNREKMAGMAKKSKELVKEKFDVNKVNADLCRIMGIANE
jgi:glycosyltransferase involved in cell wall biosynthesis